MAEHMDSSGTNRTFGSGAVRDGGRKPAVHLISPHAMLRLGEWLRYACEDRDPPYPPRNWEKGIPISECIGSLQRHVEKFKLGMTDEDHVAAMLFNAMAIAHFEEEINAGRLDPAIDDMPHYAGRPGVIRYEDMNAGMRDYVDRLRDSHATLKLHVPPPESGNTRCETCCQECACECEGSPCPSPAPATQVVPPTAYISGPMRGRPQGNFPAFDQAEVLGRLNGYRIISPATMDREAGVEPTEALVPTTPGDFACLRDIGRRDTEALLSLRAERGDAIAMLDDWQQSQGARMEFFLAKFLGLKVLNANTFQELEV